MLSAKEMLRIFDPLLRPIRQRILGIVALGNIESVKDDSGVQLAKISVLKDETREDVERFQNVGFTSHPVPGAEAIVIAAGGNRDHSIIIATDDRNFRVRDLPEGGAAMYSSVDGETEAKQILKVLPDGTIELGKGVLEKIINGETFLTFFNAHTHTGNLIVPTGPPIVPMVGATHLSQKVKADT